MFSALLAYIAACEWTSLALVPCVAMTAAAVLCKEQGITVVAVCIVYDVFVHSHFDLIPFITGQRNYEDDNESDDVGDPQPRSKFQTSGNTKKTMPHHAQSPAGGNQSHEKDASSRSAVDDSSSRRDSDEKSKVDQNGGKGDVLGTEDDWVDPT